MRLKINWFVMNNFFILEIHLFGNIKRILIITVDMLLNKGNN